ncbi:hypothetical protein C2S51_002193 [Perilla frutescens var. frutescens]|nr:hypothetical protein C2S51_002193 [Perilla frutescens var. frutescens]
MAHYDSLIKNRGLDGYGQPVMYGIGYHATKESYAASTEQVVSLGHVQLRQPRSSTHVQPDVHSPKFNNGSPRDYSPKFNSSPHDSPRKTFQGSHSPPPGHHSGIYGTKLISPHDSHFRGDDDSSDDDDDVECRDGVCYPKPKHGGYYHLQPRKDSHEYHHQKSDPPKYHEKLPEGNTNIYAPNSYKTDPYYDRNNVYANSKNDPYYGKSNNTTLPAPIKTREPDQYYRDVKNSPVSAATHRTPFGPASPRKDRRQVIDTMEAQRRYGNAPPHSDDQRHKPTIDSQTAAKMYGGVFVK